MKNKSKNKSKEELNALSKPLARANKKDEKKIRTGPDHPSTY
ncbi:hypothetical protein [Halobacillus hunanensis]|nr:hypothetical protein [Halobacillus hunanensis]